MRCLWHEAGARTASVALIAETWAALASARRSGRLDDVQHRVAVASLGRLWGQIIGIVLTEPLAHRAGELADAHALRGYDAIHLASAEAILDDHDVMIVADLRLAGAAKAIGIEALVPAGA